MKKPDGIEIDPDVYAGKETQHFYIEKDVKPEHIILKDFINHIGEYVEVPEKWKTLIGSIVLYIKKSPEESSHRLFTIEVVPESDETESEAFVRIRDDILKMELIRMHASDEVVSVKNAFFVCDEVNDETLGEFTFCIYLNSASVQ